MKKNTTFKIALCGILSTLATIAFVIENLFPPLFLPGAKIGVSNIFILFALISLGGGYAFFVLIAKVMLGSLFSGNVSAIIYSLPAGVIALTAETIIVYLIKKTSIIATSIVGAIFNVIVQNIVFCLVTGAAEYLCYLPYLSLIGIFSGLTVGVAVFLLNKYIPIFR